MDVNEKLRIMEQALRDIIDPIPVTATIEGGGNQFNPMRVRMLTKDYARLKSIAKKALEAIAPQCPHCNCDLGKGESLPPTGHGFGWKRSSSQTGPLKGDDVKLIPVYKCGTCGYSESIDKYGASLGIELTR